MGGSSKQTATPNHREATNRRNSHEGVDPPVSRHKKPVRADSAEGKRALLVAAKTSLQPVQSLSEGAMGYFDHYTSTRPSYDWSRGDLVRLTKLCERMAEVDTITNLINEEGLTVINQRGTQIPNPLISVRDSLERICMAAERSLSVYSPMEGGKKSIVAEQAKQVEKLAGGGSDDLLA